MDTIYWNGYHIKLAGRKNAEALAKAIQSYASSDGQARLSLDVLIPRLLGGTAVVA